MQTAAKSLLLPLVLASAGVSSAYAAAHPPGVSPQEMEGAPGPRPQKHATQGVQDRGGPGEVHDVLAPHEESPDWTLEGLAKGAQLLGNLGKVHRNVTTTSQEAQAFFDQGLALTWGFNHDEAARSFAKAGTLDPTCALCFWGAAYTMGPNYNMPMLPERAKAAWDALERAKRAAPRGTPVEQAIIAALAHRYEGPAYVEPTAMAPLNVAYARAMGEVARQFPNDLDVLALAAEAKMDVNPWRLWTKDGKPEHGTEDIVALLKKVLDADPEHAGANHFYIHALEASPTPGLAVDSADRLPRLIPGAGHIVHMPAHIYQRVGRYGDAMEANRRAIVVDREYMRKIKPLGYYSFYLSHNHGFLAYAAGMAGRKEEALSASRAAASTSPRQMVCGMPGMDFFLALPILVEVRFGLWDALLKEPMPDPKYQTLLALYHHGQGMALAAQGRLGESKNRVATIRAIARSLPAGQRADLNIGRDVLEVAASVVEARIAELERKPEALSLWARAAALEDKLAYSEPADWFYPVRHYWGAALLDAGKAQEAEKVYWEDLQRNPENGWALFGLWKALEAQGRPAAALQAQQRFERAWSLSDTPLWRSAF